MKNLRLELARLAAYVLIIGAFVAGVQQLSPSSAQVWKWSQTAGSNATADPSINWAEGMAPSAVNDSARAMMAALAKYRDDLAGSVTTGGTSTAYTVTTNQVLTTLTAGFKVCFSPHTTSAGTATLAVDGLAAKPLRIAPASELPSGALVQGTPYCASYFTSNSGEYILQSFFGNPYNVPLGGMVAYLGSTAPNSNFALPFGQAISRTTYAGLFAIVSTTFGTGDGSTTFNLPDLRGRTVAGLGNMGGSDAARLTTFSMAPNGTTIGATGGIESAALTIAQLAAHTHPISGLTTSSDGSHGHDAGSLSATDGGAHTPTMSSSSLTTTIQNGASAAITANSGSPATTINNGTGSSGSFFATSTFNAPTITTTLNSLTMSAVAAHTHGVAGTTTTNGAHNHTVSGATDSIGSSGAVSKMQPTIILPYIVRIF